MQQELESYKERVEELTVDLEILRNEISDKGEKMFSSEHSNVKVKVFINTEK